jgi:hypothetical protein
MTLRCFAGFRPAGKLREQIALMWQRLGHDVITSPAAPEIVTVKGERKFITKCAVE